MMKQTGAFPYVGILELGAFALELPYGNDNRLSMILLLPRKSSNLANIIDNLPKYGLKQLMDQLRRAEDEYPDDEVDVAIPRFRIKADFILNVILENMGLLDIFNPAYANLKRLTKNELFLSRIIHKAHIEVSEEGTVATAVTGGTFVNKSSPPKFIANRPFAYLIVEKSTQMLLFCGQVKNAPKLQF